jgi:hypothetical protein
MTFLLGKYWIRRMLKKGRPLERISVDQGIRPALEAGRPDSPIFIS